MLKTLEHIFLVGVSVLMAILSGIPIGILITRSKFIADIVLYLASIIITIPSVALFGFMIPFLSRFNLAVSYVPAIIAVFLYSLLPIIRNTYTSIMDIPYPIREAAIGIGMKPLHRLFKVEVPLSLPVIITGVRIAVVLNIGVMTIASYIGAGGLGLIISRGIAQSDSNLLLSGVLCVSILAIVSDSCLALLQKKMVPKYSS